jgi:hypothetical protein
MARKLIEHLRQKNSASVDGHLSRGSSVRRPGGMGPHRRYQKLIYKKAEDMSELLAEDESPQSFLRAGQGSAPLPITGLIDKMKITNF